MINAVVGTGIGLAVLVLFWLLFKWAGGDW